MGIKIAPAIKLLHQKSAPVALLEICHIKYEKLQIELHRQNKAYVMFNGRLLFFEKTRQPTEVLVIKFTKDPKAQNVIICSYFLYS